MSRKIILSVVAIIAFPVAALFAGEEPESPEALIAKNVELLVAPNTPYAPNGRKAAMEYLAQNAAAAANPMITKLEAAKDPQTRLWLLLTFNEFKDPASLQASVPNFVGLLKDETFTVRYWAIRLLGRVKAKDAVKPLLGLLDSKDYVIKREAITALGQIGEKEAGEPVLKLIKDEEPTVRAAAADAVALLEVPGAKAKLIEAVKAKDEKVFVVKGLVKALEKITATPSGIEDKEWIGPPTVWQGKLAEWLKKL